MLTIGDIHIHIINDADAHVDGGGAFGLVPRKLWSRAMPHDEENLVLMKHHCLLVQVAGRNILVDTAFGDKLDERAIAIWHLERPTGSIIDGLARLSLKPDDIDLVVDTHLHSDHCSGNTKFGPDGEILPVFPNAEYVVQRREFEDAMRPNERTRATYLPVNYELLVQSGQMRLLDGDTEFASGVQGIVAPGHTPGHMAIRFESGGQHAAFVCDMATYSVHFERLGWMTAYDVEPLITLETKRVWQQWALETNAIIIFPHDPLRPAGRLVQPENDRPRLEPVEITYV